MSVKKISLALALATSAITASASTPILLTNMFDGTKIGSFSGAGTSEMFDFNSNAGDTLSISSVTSNYFALQSNSSFYSGYNITSVLFDGADIMLFPISGVHNMTSTFFTSTLDQKTDTFSFSMSNLAGGNHTIQINGNALLSPGTSGFTGNIQITPVPEPETYAMLLGGLALVGALTRRRRHA